MNRKTVIGICLLCGCVLLVWLGCKSETPTAPSTPQPPSTLTYEQITALFDYDTSAPLDIRLSAEEARDGYTLQTLSYAGSGGGRVPAYLLVPDGPGPFAGMIYLHWGGAYPSPPADKNEFLVEAAAMARLKTVCLLIDAPFARPVYSTGCEMYIQTVIDLRRGVDLLRARPDVDGTRLGYLGHSFGATWGGVLAGVDRRCKAYVLIAGHPNVIDCVPCNPRCTDRSLNASNVIGHAAPGALLFQFANVDEFIPRADAEAYFQAAGEPKTIRWYDCGHDFSDDQALFDRTQWLIGQLGLVR